MNAFNGEEMAGRKILVREDREDRDVKQYNKENGIERPNTRRPKRGGRGGGGGGGGGGAPRAGRDGSGHTEPHQPSGLQASSLLPIASCRCAMRFLDHAYHGTLQTVACCILTVRGISLGICGLDCMKPAAAGVVLP